MYMDHYYLRYIITSNKVKVIFSFILAPIKITVLIYFFL